MSKPSGFGLPPWAPLAPIFAECSSYVEVNLAAYNIAMALKQQSLAMSLAASLVLLGDRTVNERPSLPASARDFVARQRRILCAMREATEQVCGEFLSLIIFASATDRSTVQMWAIVLLFAL